MKVKYIFMYPMVGDLPLPDSPIRHELDAELPFVPTRKTHVEFKAKTPVETRFMTRADFSIDVLPQKYCKPVFVYETGTLHVLADSQCIVDSVQGMIFADDRNQARHDDPKEACDWLMSEVMPAVLESIGATPITGEVIF